MKHQGVRGERRSESHTANQAQDPSRSQSRRGSRRDPARSVGGWGWSSDYRVLEQRWWRGPDSHWPGDSRVPPGSTVVRGPLEWVRDGQNTRLSACPDYGTGRRRRGCLTAAGVAAGWSVASGSPVGGAGVPGVPLRFQMDRACMLVAAAEPHRRRSGTGPPPPAHRDRQPSPPADTARAALVGGADSGGGTRARTTVHWAG